MDALWVVWMLALDVVAGAGAQGCLDQAALEARLVAEGEPFEGDVVVGLRADGERIIAQVALGERLRPERAIVRGVEVTRADCDLLDELIARVVVRAWRDLPEGAWSAPSPAPAVLAPPPPAPEPPQPTPLAIGGAMGFDAVGPGALPRAFGWSLDAVVQTGGGHPKLRALGWLQSAWRTDDAAPGVQRIATLRAGAGLGGVAWSGRSLRVLPFVALWAGALRDAERAWGPVVDVSAGLRVITPHGIYAEASAREELVPERWGLGGRLALGLVWGSD